MNIRKVHCLFEQSGTFKNEFIKLGIQAEDYDILNDFGETDHVIDLFAEIERGYKNEPSIFDSFDKDDLIMAFFPCTRFEVQIILGFRGELYQFKNWSDEQKLEYDLKLHEELHMLYTKVTQLALIAIRKGLKLVIENPYDEQHYLTRYWAIRPKLIDRDRRQRGDYYKKPTQYFFIGHDPKNNFIMEPMIYHKGWANIENAHRNTQFTNSSRIVARSMIAKEYANRFIREFILDEELLNE